MDTATETSNHHDPDQAARVRKAIHSRSFAMLSTVSPAGFAHAAGVIYVPIGDELWVHTMRSSRKARNVAADGRIGVVVPVRKLPVGPPFTVQFQGRAEIVDLNDPEVTPHIESKALKAITSHGELETEDGCFIRIRPAGVVHSYGIGVSAIAVAKDPLNNGPKSVRLS
jgi:hypothetical protein